MRSGKGILVLLLAAMAGQCGVLAANEAAKASPEQLEFFEREIRPLFVENCYLCHSEHHKEAGGLRVDDFRALTDGGNSGAAIVPGDSANSILIKRVTHSDDGKTMPPERRLSEEQIADLKRWIDDGAAWPPLVVPADVDQTLEAGVELYKSLKENHWAWQPLQKVDVPKPSEDSPLANWPRDDVDQFVLAKLQENDLEPVADASKAVLLRRLTYDLTGLPPTESEILGFLLDDSTTAVETVVDRLLDSPAFGERWGRHWLDVARYSESTGSARNLPYPHAWRYRDYVIDSFNSDKPFNKFLQEQIAGDLLPANSVSQKREQLIATGFLALGVKDVNQRFQVRYDMDNVDEQIDTVSRSVLGLTVSCARCHDHKFDPITTRDYYALAGIFASTELCDALRNQMGGGGLAYYVPARLISLSESATNEPDAELKQTIELKRAEAQAARAAFIKVRDRVKQKDRGAEHAKLLQKARQEMQRAQAELVALTDPAKSGPVALGVRDSAKVSDTEIRIRGEAEQRGPIVPRGFLSVLDHVPDRSIEQGQSGRYELAKWLTDASNPLTARVAVNRIWQHLFAEGMVRTVDNFGSTGDEPSHPELLDYLAQRFINEGWSFKKLIRRLVLTRAYQLSSEGVEASIATDPSNRFIWRHAPRRLEAEEIRDTILFAANQLDRSRPNGSPADELPVREIRNNGPEASKLLTVAAASSYRSVYLPLLRGIVPNSLEVFDFAEQSLVTGRRTNTTVAPQALFLLNDSFVRSHSVNVVRRLNASEKDHRAKVVDAYRLILNRQPSSDEIQRAADFIDEFLVEYTSIQSELQADAEKFAQGIQEEIDVETENSGTAPAAVEKNEKAAKQQGKKGVQELTAAAAPRGWSGCRD